MSPRRDPSRYLVVTDPVLLEWPSFVWRSARARALALASQPNSAHPIVSFAKHFLIALRISCCFDSTHSKSRDRFLKKEEERTVFRFHTERIISRSYQPQWSTTAFPQVNDSVVWHSATLSESLMAFGGLVNSLTGILPWLAYFVFDKYAMLARVWHSVITWASCCSTILARSAITCLHSIDRSPVAFCHCLSIPLPNSYCS